MRRQVAPDVSAGRLVHVGNLLQQRIAVRHHALEIVRALAAAIVLLPGLLQIIRADGRIRPHVPIARHLARIEEVIEHAELQRQLVLVGSNRLAIHGQAGIAISHRLSVLLQIAKNLIVGAILLDDVDDVLESDSAMIAPACREDDLLLRRLHAVRLQHFIGPVAAGWPQSGSHRSPPANRKAACRCRRCHRRRFAGPSTARCGKLFGPVPLPLSVAT